MKLLKKCKKSKKKNLKEFFGEQNVKKKKTTLRKNNFMLNRLSFLQPFNYDCFRSDPKEEENLISKEKCRQIL